MIKNILNLKGAQKLSKKVQLTIHGGAGEECPRRCEENTCTSSEYPQCIAFSCTKTDGTVVHETMCMPDNQQ